MRPPASTDAVRLVVLLFFAAVTVSVALPDPLFGDTVAQVALDEADHWQPDEVVSVTVLLPPALVRLDDVGDSEKVHAAPAWVTDTVRPATAALAVRLVVAVLAGTLSVTVSGPLPDVLDAVTHVEPGATVQAQPSSVSMLTEVDPAVLPNDALVGVTV